jgi:hypothetical protein
MLQEFVELIGVARDFTVAPLLPFNDACEWGTSSYRMVAVQGGSTIR